MLHSSDSTTVVLVVDNASVRIVPPGHACMYHNFEAAPCWHLAKGNLYKPRDSNKGHGTCDKTRHTKLHPQMTDLRTVRVAQAMHTLPHLRELPNAKAVGLPVSQRQPDLRKRVSVLQPLHRR
jgi:hypothetical protein